MRFTTAVLVSFLPGAAAHGCLTKPASRNGSNQNKPGEYNPTKWYTAPAKISGSRKFGCDGAESTEKRYCPGNHPWGSPGTAKIWNPCGTFCDNCQAPGGKEGTSLAKKFHDEEWKAGGTAEVSWGMNTNHGGGYSYRLCHEDEDPTEDCFASNYLEFADDYSYIQWGSDAGTKKKVKSVIVDVGVGGKGKWKKNPLPNCDQNGNKCPFEMPFPRTGCHTHQGQCDLGKLNVVDRVKIPKTLKSGNYVMSWRWDCEETAQVWLNCADVKITGGTGTGGGGGSRPRPRPQPPASKCAADSEVNCADNGSCCQEAGMTCYEKNKYWATCKATCKKGIDKNDPPKYQTPWSCKALGTANPGGPRPRPGGGGARPRPGFPKNPEECEPKVPPGVYPCKILKKRGYCKHSSIWYPWMLENCCKACGRTLLQVNDDGLEKSKKTKFSDRVAIEIKASGEML